MKTLAEYQEFWVEIQTFLAQPHFEDPEGQQKLWALINAINPASLSLKHSSEQSLVAHLTDQDTEVQRLTRLAISLLILSKDTGGSDVAERIRKCEGAIQKSLNFSRYFLPTLPPEAFQVFCEVIKNTEPAMLTFLSNNASVLQPAEVQSLHTVIKNSKLRSLHLDSNNLAALQPSAFQSLLEDMENLEWIYLFMRMEQPTAEMKALFEAGRNSTLDITRYFYYSLPQPAEVQALSVAIKNSRLSNLESMGCNSLDHLQPAALQGLFEAIKNSTLIGLKLDGCNLGCLGRDQPAATFQAFCAVIKDSKLIQLDLSGNNMFFMEPAEFEALCAAIKNSKLTCLTYMHNSLSHMPSVAFQMFCEAIKNSQLTVLNLFANKLSALPSDAFQKLCIAIKDSKLFYLDLFENQLTELQPPAIAALCAAITNNSTLIGLRVEEATNILPTVAAALRRNLVLNLLL